MIRRLLSVTLLAGSFALIAACEVPGIPPFPPTGGGTSLSVSLPSSLQTEEDTPVSFNVTITASSTITTLDVTLTATKGTLTLDPAAGLTFITGDGVNDTTVRFTGPKAAVIDAVTPVTYTPNPGATGGATITVDVRDITPDNGSNRSFISRSLTITPDD